MSSSATIEFEPDTHGVPADQWLEFCAEHGIEHSPNTVGGNVYYCGGMRGVEIRYTVHNVSFSTFWMGKAIPEVARIAMLAWSRWGGQLSACPEIRVSITTRVTGGR